MNKKANTHNVGKSVRSKTSLAASAFGFVVLFGATACVPPKPIRVDFNVNQNVEVDQKGSTSEEHDSNVELRGDVPEARTESGEQIGDNSDEQTENGKPDEGAQDKDDVNVNQVEGASEKPIEVKTDNTIEEVPTSKCKMVEECETVGQAGGFSHKQCKMVERCEIVNKGGDTSKNQDDASTVSCPYTAVKQGPGCILHRRDLDVHSRGVIRYNPDTVDFVIRSLVERFAQLDHKYGGNKALYHGSGNPETCGAGKANGTKPTSSLIGLGLEDIQVIECVSSYFNIRAVESAEKGDSEKVRLEGILGQQLCYLSDSSCFPNVTPSAVYYFTKRPFCEAPPPQGISATNLGCREGQASCQRTL